MVETVHGFALPLLLRPLVVAASQEETDADDCGDHTRKNKPSPSFLSAALGLTFLVVIPDARRIAAAAERL